MEIGNACDVRAVPESFCREMDRNDQDGSGQFPPCLSPTLYSQLPRPPPRSTFGRYTGHIAVLEDVDETSAAEMHRHGKLRYDNQDPGSRLGRQQRKDREGDESRCV
jgi:hypothetical protein